MNINEVKIVADSSADLPVVKDVPFASAPLKIVTDEKEYTDDEALDVEVMVNDLAGYSGKSSTACPAPEDWLSAFDDAKYVFCVSITSNLSGSYNAACIAKQSYEEKYPDRKVYVFDTLSTGPEMVLIIEKIAELVQQGCSFEETCEKTHSYMQNTALIFMLESMRNLANNGRVSHLVAKAAGILGIRVIGKASDEGTLEILDKHRGEKKTFAAIVNHMKNMGYKNGKIKLGHAFNEKAAAAIQELIKNEFGNVKIDIYKLRGLTSFYAEKGGIILGFEVS